MEGGDSKAKYLRRLKVFFDEKQKTKQRLHSLYSYFETSNPVEISELLRDHLQLVFILFDAGVLRQKSKLSAAMLDNPDRLSGSKSRHLIELFNIYECMRKILLISFAVDTFWSDSKNLDFIVRHLSTLLHYQNDHRLRLEGYRLAILCIIVHPPLVDEPRIMDLILGGIILDEFQNLLIQQESSGSNSEVEGKRSFCVIKPCNSLYDPQVEPICLFQTKSSSEEVGEMFDEILYAIIASASKVSSYYIDNAFLGDDSRSLHVSRLFGIVKNQFLNRFIPKFHHLVQSGPKFTRCPPIFLRSLLALISRYSLKTSPHTCSDLLNNFLFGEENFQYSFELIKSGLQESVLYPRTIRYSLHIIKIWMLVPLKEISIVRNLVADVPASCSENAINNILVQQCLKLIPTMFANTPNPNILITDQSGTQLQTAYQTSLFLEAISMIKSVVLSPYTLLESDTCELLQNTLLQIFKYLVTADHPKPVINGIMENFIETVLTIWIRAATKNSELWAELKICMCKSLEFNSVHTIVQWGKIMKSLAVLYSKYVLGIDLSTLNQTQAPRNRNRSIIMENNEPQQSRLPQRRHQSDAYDLSQVNTEKIFMRTASFTERSRDSVDTSKLLYSLNLKSSQSSGYIFIDISRQRFREHPYIYRELDASEYAVKQMNSLSKKVETEFRILDDLPFWNDSAITYMYQHMLRVVGDINLLKDPSIHYEAFLAISNVLDLFLQCKMQQPFQSTSYPPLFEFSVWLLDSINLHASFRKSKCIAISFICKLLCRKMHGKQDLPDPPQAFYGRAFSALIRGLFSQDSEIISNILSGSTRLFHLNIPSVEVLICAFVFCISKWTGTSLPNVPIIFKELSVLDITSSDISNILRLLLSLLRIVGDKVTSKEQLSLLVLNADKIEKHGELASIDIFNAIKSLILSLATESLSKYASDNELAGIALSGCTYVAFIELENRKGNTGIAFDQLVFENAMNCLLRNLHSDNRHAILIAVDCLSSFTHTFELFEGLPEGLMKGILDKYIGSIAENVYFIEQSNTSTRNLVLPRLLYGVLDWLVAVPKSLMMDNQLRHNIFEIIENIVSDTVMSLSRLDNHKNIKKSKSRKFGSTKELANISKSQEFQVASNLPIHETSIEKVLNSDLWSDTENPVQEAAENVYLHLLHFHGNFPTVIGPSSCSSFVVEDFSVDEDPATQQIVERAVLSFHDKLIISIEISEPDALVIIRNSIGKFAWKLKPVAKRSDSILIITEKRTFPDSLDSHAVASDTLKGEEREKTQWNAYDCFHVPERTSEVSVPRLTVKDVLNHLHVLEAYNSSLSINSNRSPVLKFLNHEAQGLWRDIKGLDKKPGRESIKVAVIYVAPGQEDEYSILSNQLASSSTDFQEFAEQLGWLVDVETHSGFLAGLERSGATGKFATYYCTSTLEMIFHDVTQMPNDPLDVKQVKKKRHIGNDHVHIIWNDHHRPYNANTIAGDYGNMQIIVTPLQRDLYSIDIRRSGSEFFGPLVSSMVVSKFLLAPLVRVTSIHAYRETLNERTSGNPSINGYRRPFHHRLNDIKMITSRHQIITDSK